MSISSQRSKTAGARLAGRGIAAMLPLSLALYGCGGGGGDAGTPGVPAAGALALDSSNYVTAAQLAVSSAAYLTDSSRLVVAAQASGSGASSRAALAQIDRLGARFARAPKLLTGAVASYTDNCTGGGTVSISANDQNNNGNFDAGDSMSMNFNGCTEDGVTMNGGLDVVISALTGNLDSTSYSATLAMTLKNLSAGDANSTETGNGQMVIRTSATGVNNETTTVEAPALSTSGTLGGVAVSSSLSGYTLTLTHTPAGNGYTESLNVAGTLGGSTLGGKTITISTPTTIVRDWNALLPRAGLVLVKGGSGSQMRITVQAAGTVLIELDADGNGAYETSVTKTWAQLGG